MNQLFLFLLEFVSGMLFFWGAENLSLLYFFRSILWIWENSACVWTERNNRLFCYYHSPLLIIYNSLFWRKVPILTKTKVWYRAIVESCSVTISASLVVLLRETWLIQKCILYISTRMFFYKRICCNKFRDSLFKTNTNNHFFAGEMRSLIEYHACQITGKLY